MRNRKTEVSSIYALPENTTDEIRDKIHCLLDENRQLKSYIGVVEQRIRDNEAETVGIMSRNAARVRKKYGLETVEFLSK